MSGGLVGNDYLYICKYSMCKFNVSSVNKHVHKPVVSENLS